MAQGTLMLWLVIIPVLMYASILLYISGFLRKITPVLLQEQKNPTAVSVVIACRNEEKNITGLLNSIAGQSYPSPLWEVIVVDDNSSDNTNALAKAYTGIEKLKVLRNCGSGKKSAIRCGVEAASAPLVVATDADCRMKADWLRSIACFYQENKPDLIIGPVILAGPGRYTDMFQQVEWAALQGITAGTAEAGSPVLCNGANLAFTREAYLRHSANLEADLASGDDLFLLHSLKRNNPGMIKWLPSQGAAVTTQAAASLKALIKQRARWISKAGRYRDPFTILTAIVTFATNISIPVLFILAFENHKIIYIFLSALIIKVSSDLCLIMQSFNSLRMPKPERFWRIFFLSEIIYPFYTVIVALMSPGKARRWK